MMNNEFIVASALALFGLLSACTVTDDVNRYPRLHSPPYVSANPEPSVPPEPPQACPDSMVHVVGSYCEKDRRTCLRWLDPESVGKHRRCLEYEIARCVGDRIELDYCIDTYEHSEPDSNLPMSNVDWLTAHEICGAEEKRMCTNKEWTLACEGPEMLAHPYGNTRDWTACYHDKYYIDLLDERGKFKDLRLPIDTHSRCVSPYGVRNMTGNVGEWIQSETAVAPWRSLGKGGWWSIGLRSRCRPITYGHDEEYNGVQVGFRCCCDPLAGR